ncbi:hypothetical protein LCGC14_1099930 [marine sediment metagenome]|uniref:Calcineurin-like phosphoesterase domain-containing protein n=1 Tax=marine sediment metagenome TaxID=412755 RepID=A0A0F9PSY2_9ZZZZ
MTLMTMLDMDVADEKLELCWANDLHLDHAHHEKISYFARKVNERETNVVLLGGDISNGVTIIPHLEYLSKVWVGKQIYFVLGNHDYYGSSFTEVWSNVDKCVLEHSNLHWLDGNGPIKLSDKTALVGNGLWCDWKAGSKEKSSIWINDYTLIEDLRFEGAPYNTIAFMSTWEKVGFYARLHANQLMDDFDKALEQGFKNIIVLTHVPPFHEGSFFDGKVQDDDWATHFVCWIAGVKLKERVIKHKDVQVTVLCGHTHGFCEVDILPNLHVINGKAKYNHPRPQNPIYYE